MPRTRSARFPSALMKALMPRPTRKKRVRRAKPAAAAAKAVRAAVRATPTISVPNIAKVATAKPAARKPAARKPAVRKPAARKPAARKPAARKPAARRSTTRIAAARKKATRTPSTPPPSAIGSGTWRQARFTGVAGTRSYRVYIPRGLRKTVKAPLVLALHGCGQNALDFAAGTRFNELADKHKFVVVYPEQGVTHNGQRCWNWFRTAHQFRTRGEPAILAGIVRRVVQESAGWRIDPERVYATGISAGGAMALVLAATYPELFAAVGVHSSPPYRSASGPANALAAMQGRAAQPPVEATTSGAMPPLIVFHGTFDGTVRSINAQRVADQWLAYYGHEAGSSPRTGSPVIGNPRTAATAAARPSSARSRRGYQVRRWYSGGRKVLEVWLVDGLGHAWSGGSSNGSYTDARGPRASTEMWKFFSAHRSAAGAAAIRAG